MLTGMRSGAGSLVKVAHDHYDTLSAAVSGLVMQGYTSELQKDDSGAYTQNDPLPLDPSIFHIDAFHRFEGDSDPADMSILYAISSADGRVRGIVVNAFGPYANDVQQRLVERLLLRPTSAAASQNDAVQAGGRCTSDDVPRASVMVDPGISNV